jgi:predicted DNA repair protein MutK
LFTLIDDIATVLDDVALLTKVAAKKTAGVLGDDLALNAQQVSGVSAERELPVVWAVAKGSMLNKVILVPAALAISALAPWAVTPLLMLGGLFLCYEGVEKLAHKFLHSDAEDRQHHAEHAKALADESVDLVAFEKDKIKGAIRTDFVLSAEIIVITLGTVAGTTFLNQVIVLSGIAVIMTAGVYGFVAGIVKVDDAGLYLIRKSSAAARAVGNAFLWIAPRMMNALSVLGTAAMFMVGGGILSHGMHAVSERIKELAELAGTFPRIGGVLHAITPTLLDAVVGVLAGVLALAVMTIASRVLNGFKR